MWSFPTTDLLTGVRVSEHVPFTGVSFQDTLMDGGSFTGTMPLDFAALSPDLRDHAGRWVTWPSRDGVPFGAFWWMSGPTVGLDSTVQQVQAARFDAVFKDRRVVRDLVFTNQDQLDVARDLFREGAGLGTTFTAPPLAPDVSWSPAAAIPWLRLGAQTSTTVISRTQVVNGQDDDGFRAKARKPILDCVKALADNAGFEFVPRYGVDPTTGDLFARIDFGAPMVGTPAWNADRIVLEYPGGNIVGGSYAWDAANTITRDDVVGGEAAGAVVVGSATSTAMHAAGYPLRMSARSENSITDQTDLTGKATAGLARRARIMDGYSLVLDGSTDPVLGSYGIGDHVTIRVRRGNRTTIDERIVRIVGWTIKVDDSGLSETVVPTLAEVP